MSASDTSSSLDSDVSTRSTFARGAMSPSSSASTAGSPAPASASAAKTLGRVVAIWSFAAPQSTSTRALPE